MIGRRVSAWFLTKWVCIVGSFLLLSGCAAEEPDNRSVDQREGERIPLAISPGTGQLTIKAHLNGEEVTMAVDTAANITVFDMQLVDKLQLDAKDATGVSERRRGALPLKVAHVKEFRIGSLSYSFDAVFVDLGAPNEGLKTLGDPTIDGLLGMDFLLKWGAVIDCQEKALFIRNRVGPGRVGVAASAPAAGDRK